MIEIEDTLISQEILKKRFVCDLSACKGACCVEGDGGAPIEDNEVDIMEEIYEKVKPYMTEAGIKKVEEVGTIVVGSDNELETPLLNGRECAYVYHEEDGMVKCAIEKAYLNKEIDFKKPVSCHLYPIRVEQHKTFRSVNFHHWDICKPACDCGSRLNVKTFKFLKEPLIRKFGVKWYGVLEEVDREFFSEE